jgi:hypothetical protein
LTAKSELRKKRQGLQSRGKNETIGGELRRMSKNQEPSEPNERSGLASHWVLWTAVSTFVVMAISGMWAIDYFYSPEMNNPSYLSEAVGK